VSTEINILQILYNEYSINERLINYIFNRPNIVIVRDVKSTCSRCLSVPAGLHCIAVMLFMANKSHLTMTIQIRDGSVSVFGFDIGISEILVKNRTFLVLNSGAK